MEDDIPIFEEFSLFFTRSQAKARETTEGIPEEEEVVELYDRLDEFDDEGKIEIAEATVPI